MSRNKTWFRSETIMNFHNIFSYVRPCKANTIWKNSMINLYENSNFVIEDCLDNYYQSRGYQHPDLYHTIINERGKERLICSLKPDARLVQKTLNQSFLLPAFTPALIKNNCASLKGRGVDFALREEKKDLVHAYQKYGDKLYSCKIDLHNYFDTIPHEYLMNKMMPYMKKDIYLQMYFENLFILYQKDFAIHNGENVPYGIGLGGEIPQTFGIIFLDDIDHYFKEKYHFKWYVRYMDDIIILSNDREKLKDSILFLIDYLKNFQMSLNLNKTVIAPISEGYKFLKIKYLVKKDSGEVVMRPNKKTIKRLQIKLDKMVPMLERGEITFNTIRQMYYSTRGVLSRGNSYLILNYLDQLFETLYFDNWLGKDVYQYYKKEIQNEMINQFYADREYYASIRYTDEGGRLDYDEDFNNITEETCD